MLTIDLDEFMIEIQDGTIKHVGSSTTSVDAKLYDVTEAEARHFGDQIKFAFEDGEGNMIEVALNGPEVQSIVGDLNGME
ncbi:hypothetical protein [Halosegnis longus]|uniref:hypothetical protein n=1 Tax=Halosegnis longus TaxID=2216012 RepID=UPI00096ABEC0|nr:MULTISPECIES: hypothetical protein [Halobacteriales]